MIKQLMPATLLTVILTLLCGLVYPLTMTGVAAKFFPAQAQGSLILKQGVVVGSHLIGQAFTKPEYFHPRPSATVTADPQDASKTIASPYNAASSQASNLAVSSKTQKDAMVAAAVALNAENGLPAHSPVPLELITASGSGLDPHLSPEAALYQVNRVAQARQIAPIEIIALINSHREGKIWGLFGMPTVNVLDLNLMLDERWPMR